MNYLDDIPKRRYQELKRNADCEHIKEITNALAATSFPVNDHDFLLIILNGLPDEYDSFVDSVQFRLADTSIDDLHGFFLNKEMTLARKKQAQGSSTAEFYQALNSIQAASTLTPLLPTPQAYTTQNTNSSNFTKGNSKRHNNSYNRGGNRY
ncbi:uncharacterized protein [Pyrus communis]|uniref:uncharacterized protein n=1 Tax=Pyrus communis TaxID=23211 RepID=UPI0035BED852